MLLNRSLSNSDRLFVLTGAGISAESGIKTFRDAGGLWEGHRIEEVASPEGFRHNPQLVIDFYNLRRQQLFEVQPNPAHVALAECAQRMGPDRFFLVTQNVDDLHERAGSPQVLHMHGELKKLECLGPIQHVIPWTKDQRRDDLCPLCQVKLRPHIVWFGEVPLLMEAIETRLSQCTHFMVVGSSGVVYPAANFKSIAHRMGADVLVVNLDQQHCRDSAHETFSQGKAAEVLPELMENWT
jgi:NAD-dependent deacetylase